MNLKKSLSALLAIAMLASAPLMAFADDPTPAEMTPEERVTAAQDAAKDAADAANAAQGKLDQIDFFVDNDGETLVQKSDSALMATKDNEAVAEDAAKEAEAAIEDADKAIKEVEDIDNKTPQKDAQTIVDNASGAVKEVLDKTNDTVAAAEEAVKNANVAVGAAEKAQALATDAKDQAELALAAAKDAQDILDAAVNELVEGDTAAYQEIAELEIVANAAWNDYVDKQNEADAKAKALRDAEAEASAKVDEAAAAASAAQKVAADALDVWMKAEEAFAKAVDASGNDNLKELKDLSEGAHYAALNARDSAKQAMIEAAQLYAKAREATLGAEAAQEIANKLLEKVDGADGELAALMAQLEAAVDTANKTVVVSPTSNIKTGGGNLSLKFQHMGKLSTTGKPITRVELVLANGKKVDLVIDNNGHAWSIPFTNTFAINDPDALGQVLVEITFFDYKQWKSVTETYAYVPTGNWSPREDNVTFKLVGVAQDKNSNFKSEIEGTIAKLQETLNEMGEFDFDEYLSKLWKAGEIVIPGVEEDPFITPPNPPGGNTRNTLDGTTGAYTYSATGPATTTIGEGPVPLANIADTPVPLAGVDTINIADENVPLAALPASGGYTSAAQLVIDICLPPVAKKRKLALVMGTGVK